MARRYRRTTASRYAPDEVIITAGGKQALFHAAMALFGPGDEVITHVPGWPTIVEQIKLAGAHAGDRAHAGRGRLRAARRRAPRRRDAADARHRHQLAGQSDRRAAVRGGGAEARGRGRAARSVGRDRSLLRPADLRRRAAQPAEDLRRRHARSAGAGGSASKSLRDDRLALRLAGRTRSRSSRRATRCRATRRSNVNSITQKAASPRSPVRRSASPTCSRSTRQRRDQVLAWLAEEPRLACAVPHGAFYLFPIVSEFLSPDGCRTSLEFADALLATSTSSRRRRGVRRARLSAPLVRDVARAPARGRHAPDSVRAKGRLHGLHVRRSDRLRASSRP